MTTSKSTVPNYQSAKFLLSAAKLSQLPPDLGVEVAFVGRSNAGKSSVLNQITKNQKLARVSKTPGRTQHINLFTLDKDRRLIDLPGYGYAEVPAEVKRQWQKTLDAYLQTRDCLYGLIVVMDIRHPLTDFDQHLLEWAASCGLNVHILLNKADKISFGAAKKTLLEVEKFVKPCENLMTCQLFSALKKTGVGELRALLDSWFSSQNFHKEETEE